MMIWFLPLCTLLWFALRTTNPILTPLGYSFTVYPTANLGQACSESGDPLTIYSDSETIQGLGGEILYQDAFGQVPLSEDIYYHYQGTYFTVEAGGVANAAVGCAP